MHIKNVFKTCPLPLRGVSFPPVTITVKGATIREVEQRTWEFFWISHFPFPFPCLLSRTLYLAVYSVPLQLCA